MAEASTDTDVAVRETDLVVVGVDGSPNSVAALRWAIDEAVARHWRVEAVHAWLVFPPLPSDMGAPRPTFPSFDEEEQQAKNLLVTAVEAAWPGEPPVTVSTTSALGQPSDILVKASERATLLVVGARGHTGIGELLVGSTTTYVVKHSQCPVVVVPAPHR